MLATGDLSRFDTIVVGVRASEARPDFVANHGRLREYMERGGTLIVQYQQTDYVGAQPAAVSGEDRGQSPRDRRNRAGHDPRAAPSGLHVSRTRSPSADFDGWVQERNLYAFGTFDGTLHAAARDRPIPASRRSAAARCTPTSARAATSTRPTPGSASCRPACPARTGMFANLVSLSKALQ